MNELRHPLAIAALALAGLATLLLSWQAPPMEVTLLAHRQIMMAMLGSGLLLSLFVPVLRLAVAAAGVLSMGALLGVLLTSHAGSRSEILVVTSLGLLLALAGAVFAYEAWQEARWDRGSPLRQG